MLDALTRLEVCCSATIMHARRIVRTSERRIATLSFDYQTLYELGAENIGILICGADSTETLIDHIGSISRCNISGRIVVAAASGSIADWCYSMFSPSGRVSERPEVFDNGCVTFTTPESMRKVTVDRAPGRPVIAVLVLDPMCIVHRARGTSGVGWCINDRPQHVARMRYKHSIGDWRPPLCVMTTKRAKSLNTNTMLAPYGLDAWWYVDASTLRIGAPPQVMRNDVTIKDE